MSHDLVWCDRPKNWSDWSAAERTSVENFLRAHDIDPADVQIGVGNEMVVRLLASGAMELSVWVVDRVDGATVRCPNCPGCVRQKPITRRVVTTTLPMTSTSWVVPTFAVAEETNEGAST